MSAQNEPVDERQHLNFSCHCGNIKLSAPRDPTPTHINDCKCSNCRKHGASFVYYPVDKVTITKAGPTKGYLWAERNCEYTWCDTCGCLTHWYPTETSSEPKEIGVNTSCIDDPKDLEGVERREDWETARAKLEGVYDENGPVRR